ncbi:2OG-Fe(II) oxygenase [Aquabacterium sp. A08]|uniref:2OG-Fe(II) oxygenase n=1 Tax=Aquabacterium sp. A08 TaxID=2718532 RepID=UPI00141FCF33|nr:2OG-Fe(II) oxygenase [Aquabacterium sp. A08]NIC41509.1 2-oxoglutarate-dependent dioxygenase [Aquabacterium sp. A08]
MSQTVTPELRAWIVAQATAGFAPDAVLRAMVEAGWTEAVALDALEHTLSEHLAQRAPAQPVSQPPRRRASAPADGAASFAPALPQPDLRGAPRLLDAGDREVAVLASLRRPQLVVFGNLLAPEECEALVAAARPRMSRSLTVETQTGGEALNADRTSQGMFFRRGETELIARIEARIARLLHWPVSHGEGLQVLQYRPGAEYKPHYDYFDPREPGTAKITQRGGQRVATLVIYLNEPVRGGGTTFPDVGLEVAPQRGNAVFFAYDRPHPATQTLHGGAPVLEGEKWVATKWLREREFT